MVGFLGGWMDGFWVDGQISRFILYFWISEWMDGWISSHYRWLDQELSMMSNKPFCAYMYRWQVYIGRATIITRFLLILQN